MAHEHGAACADAWADRPDSCDTAAALEEAMEAFALHLRAFEEPGLAAAVEGARDGDPDRLPQRVLSLFSRGMGGLLDVPLYRNGAVDQPATVRRDELATAVFEAAKASLGKFEP